MASLSLFVLNYTVLWDNVNVFIIYPDKEYSHTT